MTATPINYPATPEAYCTLAYARLVELLAWWALPCPICGQRRYFDPSLRLWAAHTAFTTAKILSEGGDPWAPVSKPSMSPTNEIRPSDLLLGSRGVRAKARRAPTK